MKQSRIHRNGKEKPPQGKLMKTAGNARIRGIMIIALLAWGVLSSPEHGRAAVTVLRFGDAAAAVDNGPQDGVFDALVPLLYDLGPVNNNGWTSFRTALEFDLRVLPPGATINSASLDATLMNYEGPRQIALHGYVGDGTVTLSDFAIDGILEAQTIGPAPTALHFDVTSFMSGLQSRGAAFAGFSFREYPANQFNFVVMNLSMDPYSSPQLSVDYTVVPEPTGLAILGLGVVRLVGWRRGAHAVDPQNGQIFARAADAGQRVQDKTQYESPRA